MSINTNLANAIERLIEQVEFEDFDDVVVEDADGGLVHLSAELSGIIGHLANIYWDSTDSDDSEWYEVVEIGD